MLLDISAMRMSNVFSAGADPLDLNPVGAALRELWTIIVSAAGATGFAPALITRRVSERMIVDLDSIFRNRGALGRA
jgi:hypothetical protein